MKQTTGFSELKNPILRRSLGKCSTLCQYLYIALIIYTNIHPFVSKTAKWMRIILK